MNYTIEEINRRIDAAARKRDHAADVMGNVLLAWTYQQDIDVLVEELKRLENDGREGSSTVSGFET